MDLRGEPDILGVTPFAPQRPRMSNCKYFQVCNLPGQVIINQEPYCVFHDPRREKTRSEFEYQLSRLVNKGVSDFRNFVFPQGSSFKYENQTFRNLLNLEGVALDTLLDLTGATLQCGLSLSVQKINSINIRNVTTHGPVTISVEDKMDTFNCEGIRAASSIHFSAKSCERVLFGRSDVIERVAIVIESMIRDASFQDAHLHGDLDLQCSSIATLIIGDAVITKSTRVALDSGEVTIRAAGCHLQGESTLNAKRIAELNEWRNN